MLTPRSYLYFSVVLVLFWLSCVIFGIKANIDRSEASCSQSRTRKNHPKKKNPSPSCFLHQRVVSVIFLLGPRKLSFSCVSHYQKKGDPRKTHHSPTAKTHKINTHRRGTQQPPAVAKPNTSPHSPAAKTQHLTLDHRC